jgi:hypothetical protein
MQSNIPTALCLLSTATDLDVTDFSIWCGKDAVADLVGDVVNGYTPAAGDINRLARALQEAA